ncbi:integrase family protein [Moniliophthora roreri MCA 2997]|uniref:Integrase family protein n=1 Tax=Moniliophthora roreri (strain MCA 2997) TaxID=1381753 RepID=V2WFN5_MONRO|nr:integrase family protein [Moniliophthora roreri MCA 2997]
MKHIQIINGTTLKLTLLFWKTNQFGDIKPFYIKMFPEEYEHLCPVRALMEWIRVSRVKSGYICRKISKLDEVHDNRHEPMTSQQFLKGFWQNLLDVHVDPSSYGGHSFRCGGCQWLSVYRWWLLRKICEWGG